MVDPALRARTIAIVGFAMEDRPLIPWDDPATEIWGLNMSHSWMQRWDRLFEMHDRETLELETAELKRDNDHLGTLQAEAGRPIYMLDVQPDIPCSVRYPIEAFTSYFGEFCQKLRAQPYATSTFGFMMGLAIMKLRPGSLDDWTAPAEIQVYGVPLLNDEEYAYQRENATFFAGFAMGRHIQFALTPHSAWLEADGLYGYTDPTTVTLLKRLQAMAVTDATDYDAQFDAVMKDNDTLKTRAATVDGARQYARKLNKRLTILLRGGKI